MTPEQKLDRLERHTRLLYEAVLADSREPRKQTAQLKAYVEAHREFEVAKLAMAAETDNPGANESFYRAAEILKQAREALKH